MAGTRAQIDLTVEIRGNSIWGLGTRLGCGLISGLVLGMGYSLSSGLARSGLLDLCNVGTATGVGFQTASASGLGRSVRVLELMLESVFELT